MMSLSTSHTRLQGTCLSITGAGAIPTVIGEKITPAYLALLPVSRYSLGQIPVLIPIGRATTVITEGSDLATLGLIQWSTTLPAAVVLYCDTGN